MGKNKKGKDKTREKSESKSNTQGPREDSGLLGKAGHQTDSFVQRLLLPAALVVAAAALGALLSGPTVAVAAMAIALTVVVWAEPYFRKRSKTVRTAVTLFLWGVVALGFYGSTKWWPDESEIHGALLPASDPAPVSPCEGLPNDAVVMHLGGSAFYTRQFPFTVVEVGGNEILGLKKASGGLLVSARIFGVDGRIVAQIVDNEFHLNPSNYFRRERPDRSTLIVYDQQATQVLNIRYLNPSNVRILGVLRSSGRETVVIEESRLVFGKGEVKRFCIGGFPVGIEVP